MSTSAANSLSSSASQRWNQRLLANSPWLHEEIGRRMLENLAWIKLQPQQCYYWQAQNGGLSVLAQLKQRYPQSQFYALETTSRALANSKQCWQQQQAPSGLKGWLARTKAAELHWLPLSEISPQRPDNSSCRLLWANMCLHAQENSKALLQQWLQLLQPNGFLMFSCLGPDSFQELRQLYRTNGWQQPAQQFTDMHDWGDRLLQVGFTDPVMDMEKIVLQYHDAPQLLQELKQLGFNLAAQRSERTQGRAWYQQLLEQLDSQLRSTQTGKLELTLEIVYGHALASAARAELDGVTRVDLATMRQLLKSAKDEC